MKVPEALIEKSRSVTWYLYFRFGTKAKCSLPVAPSKACSMPSLPPTKTVLVAFT